MKSMKSIKLSLVAIAVCGMANADEVVDLGEMSVTATKTEQATSESPASVSIVTAKDINSKSVQRADQAIQDVSGVNVRSDDDGTPSSWSNSVTLRGIPQYYRTAVLVDGIALNNAFSGGVNWSNIPVDEIEKIEVVKGPFSSLYGGNAMGGVINVITKKPTEREFNIKTGYGSNNYKNLSLSYRDKITQDLGISLNYDKKESDGYIQNLVIKTPTTGTGGIAVTGAIKTTDSTDKTVYIIGDKGKKSWYQDNIGTKLNYNIDDNQNINIGYSHHEHETEFNSFNTYLKDTSGNPFYSGTGQLDTTSKSAISEANFLFGPNGEEASKYTVGYENKITNDLALKVDVGYTDFDYWYISTGSTSTSGQGKYTDIPNQKTYGMVQLSFPLGEQHFIVAGLDINKNELHKTINTLTNWTDESSKSTLTYDSNGQSTTKAIFIQDTIDITDKLVAYAGGRYDTWETDGLINDIATSNITNYDTRKESQFSPKASLVYVQSKNTTFRTSVGQAFRAPSLSDLYSDWYSGTLLYKAAPGLKPESTTSWEVGFEHTFDTNTFIKSTYYENYLTDLMYSTSVSTTLNEKRNAGKAEIKGIEFEIAQKINEKFKFFGNYTYNKSEITENITNPLLVGKKLTYTPEKQFNVGMNFNSGKLDTSIVGKYVDSLTTKDDNSDIIKDVPGSYESHFTVDTKVAYQIQNWLKASLSVNNLLDAEYYQSGLIPGRTFYAELAFKF
ncbi:MAG: TonB-dependent receptor [Arcobacteraceae bacterium]|nr:TonB-dependent receptor [Arcobacteraceae bacterium]